ncbi:hypothetical protein LEP1GSC170_4363 [Leptospira interrogans serovar Bataviae str. HAI135]|nr:hypothetical protein LEP1GSC170_4363 [Leptospira interrogans serovar Bataviae str. HAI135]
MILSKTVLAPVGGVDFDELTEGDRLYFQLPTGSMDEKAMAKTLGGIDENGNVRNVVGEFIGIAAGKGEYHIFAKGPSGVLLQAFEERPVRLAKVKLKLQALLQLPKPKLLPEVVLLESLSLQVSYL